MPPSTWAYVAIAGLMVAHVLLLVLVAARRSGRLPTLGSEGTASWADDESDTPSEADGGGVQQCPTCGAPNDPEFRFCKACVTDLNSSGSGDAPASSREQPF